MKNTFKKIFQHLAVATVVFWSVLFVYLGFQYMPRDHHVDLYGVSDQTVTHIVHTLREARAQDTVYLHVASFGGSVKTMMQLLNSIEHSKAHVVTISEAASISAGSSTTLAGDEIIVRNPTIFMFHLARYMTFFGPVIVPLDDPIQYTTTKIAAKYSAPYMTIKEIDRYLAGEDVWVQGEVMAARVAQGPVKSHTAYMLEKNRELTEKHVKARAKRLKNIEKDLEDILNPEGLLSMSLLKSFVKKNAAFYLKYSKNREYRDVMKDLIEFTKVNPKEMRMQ